MTVRVSLCLVMNPSISFYLGNIWSCCLEEPFWECIQSEQVGMQFNWIVRWVGVRQASYSLTDSWWTEHCKQNQVGCKPSLDSTSPVLVSIGNDSQGIFMFGDESFKLILFGKYLVMLPWGAILRMHSKWADCIPSPLQSDCQVIVRWFEVFGWCGVFRSKRRQATTWLTLDELNTANKIKLDVDLENISWAFLLCVSKNLAYVIGFLTSFYLNAFC